MRARDEIERLALSGVPFPGVWADYAACRGAGPDLFFEDREAARAVCSSCAVAVECRDYARAWRLPFGVFGAEDERERRGRRRRRRVA